MSSKKDWVDNFKENLAELEAEAAEFRELFLEEFCRENDIKNIEEDEVQDLINDEEFQQTIQDEIIKIFQDGIKGH